MIDLYHGDCLTIMNELIDQGISVDMVLTDPPYGTVKGAGLDGWNKQTTKWDNILPIDEMFALSEKLLRTKGVLILFSQEPFTSNLRTKSINNLPVIYPMIWKKDHFANALGCKKAPVSYFEDITVFRKKYDTSFENPLREYSKAVFDFIGLSKAEIMRKLGHRKIDHFIRYGAMQFSLPTQEAYDEFVEFFNITSMNGFLSYDEMLSLNSAPNVIFNLPESSKFKSNILEYKKDYTNFNPTQKPVRLLEDLIKTYTNENDTVLDFTMGSGSTGVACMNTNRNFIGIELDKNYFDIATERINGVQNQKRLI